MIRPMSKARAKQHRLYLKQRREFLGVRPWCEAHALLFPETIAMFPLVRATEPHHTAGRAGSLLLDTTKWLPVCRTCHHWIQSHPAEARALGLLVPEGQWNATSKTSHKRRE